MLIAIHKKTGKRIEAHKLRLDASWVGSENDEWIAPTPEVSNWEELKANKIFEVKVGYIKNHKSQREGISYMVRDHFRIKTKGARDSSENESEEHKLAKEGIYYTLIDDKIDLVWGNEKVKPSALGKFNLEIEERLSHNKNAKIGDVVMTFQNRHDILGKGIVFEIQLSNQTQEKTEERTYDRVKEGYSVVWMWDGMFCLNELINPELKVIPFRTALDEYDALKLEEVNALGRVMDNKILELERSQALALERANNAFLSSLRTGKEFGQTEYQNFLKEKKEEIYNDILQNLTSKIIIDEGKIKAIIQEEVTATTENLLKDNREMKVVEDAVKGKIAEALKTLTAKTGEEISSKMTSESEKIINSKDYRSCLREKFGIDLASFARTYLDAKIYDLKKGDDK